MRKIEFGYISIDHVDMDIIADMECISPVYEIALLEAEEDIKFENERNGIYMMPYDLYLLARDKVDADGNIDRSNILLFGDWERDGYDFIPIGELSFMLDSNRNMITVIKSTHITKGSLSILHGTVQITDGSGARLAYCLPPDLMDPDWMVLNKRRLIHAR